MSTLVDSGGANRKSKVEAFSCSVGPNAVVPGICKVKELPLIQDETCMYEIHSFSHGSLPPSVYPDRH